MVTIHRHFIRGLLAGVLGIALACAALEPRGTSEAPPSPTEAAISAATPTEFTNDPNGLKFVVLGDFGTGERAQYVLAERMVELRKTFPFELVLLVGDNLYGLDRPQDFQRKFEIPYKPLLDQGVKFYASLGNHDSREQRFYKLFNMDGKLFYSFKAPKQDVRFFALESTYMQPEQLKWVTSELAGAREEWKIVYQHHPLYSSGLTHGSDEQLRAVLEPLFIKNGVKVVLTGHDHIYERTKPQRDITYFVAGSGGKLRPGDFRPNQPFSARVVDNTNVFMAMEIVGDVLIFNAYSATGAVVDSGQIRRVTLKPGDEGKPGEDPPATPPKPIPPKPTTTEKPPAPKPPAPQAPAPAPGRGRGNTP